MDWGRAFGKVFKAENLLDHEKYAIKKVQLMEENQERVLREMRIGSKLSRSPYMAQYKASWIENINNEYEQITDGTEYKSCSESQSVIDCDKFPITGSILYVQMELCGVRKCHTLKDAIILTNNELNQSIGKPITHIGAFIASQFLEEILDGIKYSHKFGIIHRDLKTQNIFITDGRGGNFIKIGDFGSCVENSDGNDAKENAGHIKLTQRCGTEGYIPPEVCVSKMYDETWEFTVGL